MVEHSLEYKEKGTEQWKKLFSGTKMDVEFAYDWNTENASRIGSGTEFRKARE